MDEYSEKDIVDLIKAQSRGSVSVFEPSGAPPSIYSFWDFWKGEWIEFDSREELIKYLKKNESFSGLVDYNLLVNHLEKKFLNS